MEGSHRPQYRYSTSQPCLFQDQDGSPALPLAGGPTRYQLPPGRSITDLLDRPTLTIWLGVTFPRNTYTTNRSETRPHFSPQAAAAILVDDDCNLSFSTASPQAATPQSFFEPFTALCNGHGPQVISSEEPLLRCGAYTESSSSNSPRTRCRCRRAWVIVTKKLLYPDKWCLYRIPFPDTQQTQVVSLRRSFKCPGTSSMFPRR